MEKLFQVDWAELLIPTHSIAEMIVRGSLMYVALFLILRFVMKRQAGSIGIADILVIVIIADAAQNAFAKEYQSATEGVVLVGTIVLWNFLIDWLGFRFPAFGKVLEPPALPLVKDGQMLHRNMRKEFLTVEELLSQLRKKGVDNVRDVKAACIEADGEISVIKAKE
jgi:uncharacterized membrane protein YcaP (DUF421 family)